MNATEPIKSLIPQGQVRPFLQKFLKSNLLVNPGKSRLGSDLLVFALPCGPATFEWRAKSRQVLLGKPGLAQVVSRISRSSNGEGSANWCAESRVRASSTKPCHRVAFCFMSCRMRKRSNRMISRDRGLGYHLGLLQLKGR